MLRKKNKVNSNPKYFVNIFSFFSYAYFFSFEEILTNEFEFKNSTELKLQNLKQTLFSKSELKSKKNMTRVLVSIS